jgi:leader peptidase (prepilin peptidase)/N-methyltransferase
MPKTMPSVWEELTVADVVSNVFVEAATLVWVFFLGAAVGSFVNVILYRMPRRINLLWPPSRCPACLNRLKLVDNVPVVGFLRLRGKCRHCGTAIPRSYLRVEVGFGLLYLVLTYLEIHTGGWNLPLRAPNQYPGALWNLWYPRPDLVRIWVYHLALAGVLGTLFLFACRGVWFPGLFVGTAVLVGVLPTVWLSELHQVPWAGIGSQDVRVGRGTGTTEAVVGLGGGVAVGVLLVLLWPVRTAAVPAERARMAIPPRWNAAAILAVVGAWLGWQAALSVAVLTAGFSLVRPWASPATLAVVAAAVQLAGWRLLTQFSPWWPGPLTTWPLAAAWVVVAMALARLVQRPTAPLVKAEESPPESSPEPSQERTAPATPEAGSAADS